MQLKIAAFAFNSAVLSLAINLQKSDAESGNVHLYQYFVEPGQKGPIDKLKTQNEHLQKQNEDLQKQVEISEGRRIQLRHWREQDKMQKGNNSTSH